jgi:hypothetical protein
MGSPYRQFPSGNSRTTRRDDLIPDNGIVVRFHKTVLDEFYRVAFRKKIYGSIGELQCDLDGLARAASRSRPRASRA